MLSRSGIASRWLGAAASLVGIWLIAQSAVAVAAGPETVADSQVTAQLLPTPTPFRFLTPTPFTTAPRPATTTTTTTTPPRAGGFPLELAFPLLAGGAVAIGGGSLLLRRNRAS